MLTRPFGALEERTQKEKESQANNQAARICQSAQRNAI